MDEVYVAVPITEENWDAMVEEYDIDLQTKENVVGKYAIGHLISKKTGLRSWAMMPLHSFTDGRFVWADGTEFRLETA